jgi:hypothetical protein
MERSSKSIYRQTDRELYVSLKNAESDSNWDLAESIGATLGRRAFDASDPSSQSDPS